MLIGVVRILYAFLTEEEVHLKMTRTPRHIEVDIMKSIGICAMVAVHVLLRYYPYWNGNEVFSRIILALGRFPAAPSFMFCLGVGIVMSRNSSPAALLRRGVMMMGIGYFIINLFVYILPYNIYIYIYGNSVFPELSEIISSFLIVDILQFAGMTFFYFALVKFRAWKDWKIIASVICFSALGTVLRKNVSISNIYLRSVLGLLWGTSDNTCFPFASWIIYPVAGYLYGKHILSNCKDKTKLYTVMGAVGGILYAVFSYISFKSGVSFANFGESCDAGTYYHMSLDGNIAVLSFLALWISAMFFLGEALPARFVSLLQSLSRHINLIYVIHYLCIYYLAFFVGFDTLMTEAEVLLTTLVILVISEVVSSLIVSLKCRYQLR